MTFQKGIIQTNNALNCYLRKKILHLITRRRKQDVLQQFFGQIRSKRGLYDHPDALDFRYRLSNFILGRNEGCISEKANTEYEIPDGSLNNLGIFS